jgi:hypothetical protein
MNTTLSALTSPTHTINQAALFQAVLCVSKFSQESSPDFMDFGQAIKDNPRAWEDCRMFIKASDKKYDRQFALGLGVLIGVAYAAIAGFTLPILPVDQLIAEAEAVEAEAASYMAARRSA